MPSLRLAALLLTLAFHHGSASVFCPHTAYPSSEADFLTSQIQQENDQANQVINRIVGIKGKSDGDSQLFRLMGSTQNSECPGRGCVTELAVAKPKQYGSLLYHTSLIGKVIPPGFHALDVSQRRYCVIVRGDCGADVPIYRHFRLIDGRIYHAYSTGEDDTELSGNYTRESVPLCYAWAATRQQASENAEGVIKVTGPKDGRKQEMGPIEKFFSAVTAPFDGSNKIEPVPSDEKCGTGSPELDKTSVLSEYDNHKLGANRDRYYTTRKPSDKEYAFEKSLGRVMIKKEGSDCQCLVRLSQMYNGGESPGLLGARRDHKLVPDEASIIPSPLGENAGYEPTGEEMYCARESGACGASVPIRSYFSLAEMDSIITANSTALPALALPSRLGVLCYIWSIDYHSQSSNSTIVGA